MITSLRKNSPQLSGTLRNVNHHAQEARDVVLSLADLVGKLEKNGDIKEWRQGVNTHLIYSKDNRALIFRPYQEEGKRIVGVEVSFSISRNARVLLMNIITAGDFHIFALWLKEFLKAKSSSYGIRNQDASPETLEPLKDSSEVETVPSSF